MTLEQQRCSLTLPDDGYFWLDHSPAPDALAAFGNDAGLNVVLLARKTPDGFVLDEAAVATFDKGLENNRKGTKVAGAMTQFNGVPCYELHLRVNNDNSLVTVKVFVANGYLFQLFVRGSGLPLEERDKLEPIFSAFKFVGQPSVPAPRRLSEEQKAFAFSELMGQLAAYCVMGIIVILVVRFVAKRKKRAA